MQLHIEDIVVPLPLGVLPVRFTVLPPEPVGVCPVGYFAYQYGPHLLSVCIEIPLVKERGHQFCV